jgi:hypothetical protein
MECNLQECVYTTGTHEDAGPVCTHLRWNSNDCATSCSSREFPMGKTGSDASVDFQEVRLWKDYWGYFSVAAKLDAVW